MFFHAFPASKASTISSSSSCRRFLNSANNRSCGLFRSWWNWNNCKPAEKKNQYQQLSMTRFVGLRIQKFGTNKSNKWIIYTPTHTDHVWSISYSRRRARRPDTSLFWCEINAASPDMTHVYKGETSRAFSLWGGTWTKPRQSLNSASTAWG